MVSCVASGLSFTHLSPLCVYVCTVFVLHKNHRLCLCPHLTCSLLFWWVTAPNSWSQTPLLSLVCIKKPLLLIASLFDIEFTSSCSLNSACQSCCKSRFMT